MAKVQELLPLPTDGGLSAPDCAIAAVLATALSSAVKHVSRMQRFAPRSQVAGLATREVIEGIE